MYYANDNNKKKKSFFLYRMIMSGLFCFGVDIPLRFVREDLFEIRVVVVVAQVKIQ